MFTELGKTSLNTNILQNFNPFLANFERCSNLLCMTVQKIAGDATKMFSVAL
jgi:hypothetical protein